MRKTTTVSVETCQVLRLLGKPSPTFGPDSRIFGTVISRTVSETTLVTGVCPLSL